MGDKTEKKEKISEKELQRKEEAMRVHLREAYARQDTYWRERYFYELEHQAKRYVEIDFLGEKKEPDTRPNPNGFGVALADMSLLEMGEYRVTVTLNKDEKNEEKQEFTLNVTPDGIRVNSPQEASAAIDLLAGDGRSDTIIINVSPKPNFPKEADNALIAMSQMLITKGLIAKPGSNAESFLSNSEYFKSKPERAEIINKFIGMSHFARHEAVIKAAVGIDLKSGDKRQKSWLSGDAESLNAQAEKSEADIRNTLQKEKVSFADIGVRSAELEWKDLQERLEKLEFTQDRLEKVEAAERAILKNPEMVVKMHHVRGEPGPGETDKEISSRAVAKLQEVEKLPQDKMDKKKEEVLEWLENNSKQTQAEKKDLTNAMQAELESIQKGIEKLQKLSGKDEHKDVLASMEKEKTRIETLLGKDGQEGKLAKDIKARDQWNTVDRNAIFTKNQLAKESPPLPTTPRK